jgi:hypothetical protein
MNNEAEQPPTMEEPQQRSRLTRRRFLEFFGIGAGAALLLGPRQAEAVANVTATPSSEPATDGVATGKEDPTGEGDSDDPVERVQYWRRRRRRYWRRRRRWYWRGRRRFYRRRRRYWRRRRRWARRRFY